MKSSTTLKDRTSPRDPRSGRFVKYNPLARIFFCWVDPLFCSGSRRTLQHEDLYAHPPETDSGHLLDKFHRYWNKEVVNHKKGGSARLWLALGMCIWWHVLIQGILYGLLLPSLIYSALILGQLVQYFNIDSPTSSETRDAYLYAFGLSVLSMIQVVLFGTAAYMGLKQGLILRIICTSAIYEKILSLSQNTVSELTIGHVVNLVSNDVHRFDIIDSCQIVWIGPLFVLMVTYFLYVEIGASAFLATVMVIGLIPLEIVLSRLFINLRLKAAKVTDERVKVMNEVITGIRVIKMYGWEHAFHRLVSKIRGKEIVITITSSIIRASSLSIHTTSLPTMMFVIFSTYAALERLEAVNVRRVFITLSLLSTVKFISNYLFVYGILELSEVLVAIKRVKKFLLLDDLYCASIRILKDKKNQPFKEIRKTSQPTIEVNELFSSWTKEDSTFIKNVSFTIDKEQSLLAVFGAVGSGKSTLLHCLLRELPVVRGSISMEGTLAYTGQEPWIFSASLRDNILFGQPYQSDWYKTVVDVCALDKDIDILPEGDLTLVGERGVTLSGGQKARVSLARAVYCKADIYLLDDPLSAVDAAVSRHIFDKCIRGVLSQSSLVVLVTHQLQYLKECHKVLGLKEGSMEVYGDPHEVLMDDCCDIMSYMSKNEHHDDGALERSLVTDIKEEEIGKQKISFPGMIALPTTPYGPAPLENSIEEGGIEYKKIPDEEYNKGTISYKTYHNYLKAGGGNICTFGMFLVFMVTEISVVFSDWWITRWADSSSRIPSNDSNISNDFDLSHQIGIYGGLIGVVWILGFARSILFYLLLLRAATILHNAMFIAILRSPILFFDTNPIGRILNRFSKDTGFLDDVLIYTFCEFLQFFTRFLAVVVTVAVANLYLVIVVLILIVIFIILRWYFLKTGREIKRLEALARSPLYSHISMTLQGLPTIRAYGRQKEMMEEFQNYLNRHTQTWYMYIVTARWFGLRVDAVCSIFISLVAFLSIPIAESGLLHEFRLVNI